MPETRRSLTFCQPSRDSRSQEQGGAEGKGRGKGGLAAEKRDHINALGLPNDGYDYDQHLKSMGESERQNTHTAVNRDVPGCCCLPAGLLFLLFWG